MDVTPAFTAENGFATIGPELVGIRSLLEEHILGWASECGAVPMLFPALVPIRDLEALDYFKNFPHLALFADRIRPERLDDYARGASRAETVERDVTSSGYVLPSAACYSVYLHCRNTKLSEPKRVTTVATCFRNEKEYRGLERLCGFSMREIVCLGSVDAVRSHLASFKGKVQAFCAWLDLPVTLQTATDPFFEPAGERATMQRLFPVKEEFVHGGSTAIASLNFHRNFFGERCGIVTADDRPAYTGCVAFGIERWMHALLDRFGTTTEIVAVLSSRS